MLSHSRPVPISIITVTYNSASEIEDFVESIQRQDIPIELWIVDNNSTDDTLAIVTKLSLQRPWVKLLANTKNIGLAAANNMPLSMIQSKFTAFINPDIVLHPGSLATLELYLRQHPEVVAVAPVNMYADGQPHTSFHRNWTLLHLFIWRLMPVKLTRALYNLIRKYEDQDVLFASGSCLLSRTEDLVSIGGYDPTYFLAVEDVCDLCIRLRRGDRHKRVVVTNKATVTHLVSRSGSRVPYIVLLQGACGSIYHFRKHGGPLAGFIAYLIQLSSIIIRIPISLLQSFRSPDSLQSFSCNVRVLKQLLPFCRLTEGNQK